MNNIISKLTISAIRWKSRNASGRQAVDGLPLLMMTDQNNKKAAATLPTKPAAPIKKRKVSPLYQGEREKAMLENREYLLGVRAEVEKYYNGFEDEDGEEKSLYDYLVDILDFEITINSSFEYSSCKVYVTLGGPNVWIDTAEHEIKLAWGGERDSLWLDGDICDEIDAHFEELYNCK